MKVQCVNFFHEARKTNWKRVITREEIKPKVELEKWLNENKDKIERIINIETLTLPGHHPSISPQWLKLWVILRD